MAKRPSEQDGMAKDMPLICPFREKRKYFLFQGLTRFSENPK